MKVKVLETDERLGIKKGEIYQAEKYHLDPIEKMTLLARDTDGHNPMCNQYNYQLAYWIQGRWMILDGDRYVPEVI